MDLPSRLTGAAIAPVTGALYLAFWMLAEAGRGMPSAASIVIIACAVAFSRAFPVIAATLVAVLFAGQALGALPLLYSTDWPAYTGIAFIVLLAASGERLGRIVAAWVGAGAVLVVPALLIAPHPTDGPGWLRWASFPIGAEAGGVFYAYLMFVVVGGNLAALCWVVGGALGGFAARLAHAERVQQELQGDLERSEVELAVEQERNRIAQEVHDVVAHSLAVIVAQADGARYVRTVRPDAVDTSLLAIADAARTALDDVRGLVDEMMDGTSAPAPTAADVPALVEGMRAAGLRVEVRETGEPAELSPSQHLALYRILQESLTNAMRHRGRDSDVAIALDWSGPGVSVSVSSSGGSATVVDPSRAGRGIASMRERARGSGGWLAAGPDDDGGYLVTAFLPYRESVVPEPAA